MCSYLNPSVFLSSWELILVVPASTLIFNVIIYLAKVHVARKVVLAVCKDPFVLDRYTRENNQFFGFMFGFFACFPGYTMKIVLLPCGIILNSKSAKYFQKDKFRCGNIYDRNSSIFLYFKIS